jgi:hypothetical protein
MIIPTVGRLVHYRTSVNADVVQAALVVAVIDDTHVAVNIFHPDGGHQFANNVYLLQDDEGAAKPTDDYVEWMPFQKGQAAITQQAQEALAAMSDAWQEALPADPPPAGERSSAPSVG